VRLALVGRHIQRLEQVSADCAEHGVAVHGYGADLTQVADRGSLKAAVDHDFGRLDILVHSAGIFEAGDVEEVPGDCLVRQLEVNTIAPYALTHLFLPTLRRRRGDIVFINSRAGLYAYPGMTQYCASKHALRAVADGLREEVSRDGVRVISIYPGKTATPMQQRIHENQGRVYDPNLFPPPEDVAEVLATTLMLPASTVVSDVTVMPQQDPNW
jgi:short-subunit dehydrogenase